MTTEQLIETKYVKVSKRKYDKINKKYDGKEKITIKYDNKYYIRKDCYIWFFGNQKEFIEYIKKEWLADEN